MATLTRAELLRYPGDTFTDKMLFETCEAARAASPEALDALPVRTPVSAVRPTRGERELGRAHTLARSVDIRCFPGRDRTERVMHYVRAHFPRAEAWADEALREIAESLLEKAQIIE